MILIFHVPPLVKRAGSLSYRKFIVQKYQKMGCSGMAEVNRLSVK